MPLYTSYGGEIPAKLQEYRALGAKEARAHRPPSDAVWCDENESSLGTDAEKWLASEQRLFDGAITKVSNSAHSIELATGQIAMAVQQVLGLPTGMDSVEADLAEEQGRLVELAEERLNAEVDWRAFRNANDIQEPAKYPESKVWHFGLVAIFALVETVANAFFFENSQGLMGGFMVALAVAFLNLGVTFGLGNGFRFTNLKPADRRIWGWMCLIGFVCVGAYCNTLFAAFRSEYQILDNPADADQLRRAFTTASQAAAKVFTFEAHFKDLWSFLLFGIGGLLGIVSFWKGYTLDDKHPGYGDRDRALKAARAREAAAQDAVREKVKSYFRKRISDVHGQLQEPVSLMGAAADCIADTQRTRTILLTQAAAVQRDYSLVLNAYRSANLSVRATEAPQYFTKVPDLLHLVSVESADELITRLERAQSMLKSHRERTEVALNGRLKELQGLQAATLSEKFPQFLKDVEDEAKSELNRKSETLERRRAAGAA